MKDFAMTFRLVVEMLMFLLSQKMKHFGNSTKFTIQRVMFNQEFAQAPNMESWVNFLVYHPTLSNGITLHRLSSGGSGGSGSGLAVAVSMKPPIFSAAPLCRSLVMCV